MSAIRSPGSVGIDPRKSFNGHSDPWRNSPHQAKIQVPRFWPTTDELERDDMSAAEPVMLCYDGSEGAKCAVAGVGSLFPGGHALVSRLTNLRSVSLGSVSRQCRSPRPTSNQGNPTRRSEFGAPWARLCEISMILFDRKFVPSAWPIFESLRSSPTK